MGDPVGGFEELAVRAWWYGFPLVFNLDQVQRYVTTGVGSNPQAPYNRFSHAEQLATPADTFVSINNDTVYSMAQIDLGVGPVRLQVPDTSGAYYVLQFVDAWTNNFAYIGKRATGTVAGSYLLTPPGWSGEVPAGVTRISFPTRVGSIVGRWACEGTEDLPRVRALQAATTLEPVTDAQPDGLPATDSRVAPGLEFWEKLRVRMAKFPPADRDRGLQESFAPLGLLDEDSPYSNSSRELTHALTSAAATAQQQVADAERNVGGAMANGWHLALHVTDYNVDFLGLGTIDTDEWKIADRDTALKLRTIVAQGGLWGNHGYEAAYAINFVDTDGQQLTGEDEYVITFDPEPPAEAFWSLTMYDVPNYYLVDNPIDRYSIGDRTPDIARGPGGSLTVTVSHRQPEDPAANWLPAPPGPFRPCLRMYIPGADLIEGRYTIPGFQRIG